MRQYLQIKERPATPLFFRLGEFYEMFFDNTSTASKILDIALTSRNKTEEDGSVPLCGVPYRAADPYIQKLLDAGHKVAVCEQVEDPATANGRGNRYRCRGYRCARQ